MSELSSEALKYFDERQWAIHPLVPRDKKPVYDDWNRWSYELPTREQIENWWKENPNYNIGLVTGEASDVRDFDDESILIENDTGEERVILRRFLHLVIPEWHEFALLRFKRAA
ncbi:MAG: bifunctional DNA primase/polymerase [Candidatus Poribacteria bacterium]